MKNYFFIKNDVWNQFYFKEFYHDLRKKVRIVRKSYILSCNDYLKQFSINKTNKEIERIKVIISKIANKEFNLKTDEASNIYFERTSKKIIPEYIYEILYKTSHPMHKSEITRQLRLIYPELNLSIFEVSNNIKRVKDIVCYGHTSTYGLKAWGGYYGYDLKEMIEKVLRKYQRPMHISELFGILNKLTIYFSNSAIYHMKKDKSKRFIFFRGGFIGLKNIKYKSEDLNIYTNTWKLTQIVNLYIKSLSFPLSYSNILIKIKQNFKINKFQLKIVLDNIINRGWLKAISHNKYLYDGRQKK